MALAFVGRLKRSGADTDLWLRNVSPAALEPIEELSAISRACRVGVVANAMHRCVAVVRSARSIEAPVAALGGVASRWHRASACPRPAPVATAFALVDPELRRSRGAYMPISAAIG